MVTELKRPIMQGSQTHFDAGTAKDPEKDYANSIEKSLITSGSKFKKF